MMKETKGFLAIISNVSTSDKFWKRQSQKNLDRYHTVFVTRNLIITIHKEFWKKKLLCETPIRYFSILHIPTINRFYGIIPTIIIIIIFIIIIIGLYLFKKRVYIYIIYSVVTSSITFWGENKIRKRDSLINYDAYTEHIPTLNTCIIYIL